MKLIFPTGLHQFIDASGNTYLPDQNGMLDIGTALADPFIAAGFVALPDNAVTTANRPTIGVAPGLMLFDLTLNRPIWRNGANNGWSDHTGAAV